MSVTFYTTAAPDGCATSCPWDDTVYPTHQQAAEAAQRHPSGGCPAGRKFAASIAHLDDRGQLEAEREVEDRTGNWVAACIDGQVWPEPVFDNPPPEVNMSNANAVELLRALGFTEGYDVTAEAGREVNSLAEMISASCPTDIAWSGRVDPADLKARVLLARALMADVGTPSYTSALSDGSAGHHYGRQAGYYAGKLDEIYEVADSADKQGVQVVWS